MWIPLFLKCVIKNRSFNTCDCWHLNIQMRGTKWCRLFCICTKKKKDIALQSLYKVCHLFRTFFIFIKFYEFINKYYNAFLSLQIILRRKYCLTFLNINNFIRNITNTNWYLAFSYLLKIFIKLIKVQIFCSKHDQSRLVFLPESHTLYY